MSVSLKQTILSLFLLTPNLNGGELERQTGFSRAAISKAIKSLKEEGYLIESVQGSGYTYLGDGDVLNRDIITKRLKSSFGKSLDILETVDSTNLYIKRLLPNIPEGHTVVASSQDSGMGRKGRPFASPYGGLYFSVLLKPNVAINKVHFLTFCAAVAVCNAIKEVYDLTVDIKWVNDIFYNNKKLAGISTDTTFNAELMGVDSVVIGIGINIDSTPSEVSDIAIDLKCITGKAGLKNKLLASILNHLHSATKEFYNCGVGEIMAQYRKHCFILGKEIIVHDGKDIYKATAQNVMPNGWLTIRKEDGMVKTLAFAEVSIRVGNGN